MFHVFLPVFPQFWTENISCYIIVVFQVVHLYQKLLTGMRKAPPRWQFCAEITHKFFGHLLNSLLHRWSIVLSLFTSMVVWSGSRWGSWERGSPRFRGSSPDFVRPSRLRYLHTWQVPRLTSPGSGSWEPGYLQTSVSTWRTSSTVSFPVDKLCASSLDLCFAFSLSSSLSSLVHCFLFYTYM